MKEPATTWGDMAAERDTLIAALEANSAWRDALDRYNNATYRGDALRAVDAARIVLENKMVEANAIIQKYRR